MLKYRNQDHQAKKEVKSERLNQENRIQLDAISRYLEQDLSGVKTRREKEEMERKRLANSDRIAGARAMKLERNKSEILAALSELSENKKKSETLNHRRAKEYRDYAAAKRISFTEKVSYLRLFRALRVASVKDFQDNSISEAQRASSTLQARQASQFTSERAAARSKRAERLEAALAKRRLETEAAAECQRESTLRSMGLMAFPLQ